MKQDKRTLVYANTWKYFVNACLWIRWYFRGDYLWPNLGQGYDDWQKGEPVLPNAPMTFGKLCRLVRMECCLWWDCVSWLDKTVPDNHPDA